MMLNLIQTKHRIRRFWQLNRDLNNLENESTYQKKLK